MVSRREYAFANGHRWVWQPGTGGGSFARERFLLRIYVRGEQHLRELYCGRSSPPRHDRFAGKVTPVAGARVPTWAAFGFLGWEKPGKHGDVEEVGRYPSYGKAQAALRQWVLQSEVERLAMEGRT